MEKYYDENRYEEEGGAVLPIAKCVHCGKGIYEPDEAMIIDVNRNTVHMECWVDYASENYEEFLSEFYG